MLYLFPVYELKEKEGALVYKVRLVCDGSRQRTSLTTYTANPSRDELLILLHICAALDWEYCHIDQVRAFLSAERREHNTIYTRVRGSSQYWKIVHALYGLKTSPRDYQDTVVQKLTAMGYKRLPMCHSIYSKTTSRGKIIIYNYVDDFMVAGDNKDFILSEVAEFRKKTNTTEPVFDPPFILGVHLTRDRAKRIIQVDMEKNIDTLVTELDFKPKSTAVPMSPSQYMVNTDQLDLLPEKSRRLLTPPEITKYLSIVGSFNWISGVRMDIHFALLYLAWNTHAPTQHHLNQAYHVLNYLHSTKHLPLVLGGSPHIRPTGYSDCSLGTGSKGRSIVGLAVKLHHLSGAIYAHSQTIHCVVLNIFEGELDGMAKGVQTLNGVANTLEEFNIRPDAIPVLYGDNLAVIDFIHGRGSARGVRHMALRLWYTREQHLMKSVEVEHMDGVRLVADKLTKLADVEEHNKFTIDLLGLGLIGITNILHW